MAVMAAAQGVRQSTCVDCVRPRLLAVETVPAEITGVRVRICTRVTIIEGCSRCEGDSVIL